MPKVNGRDILVAIDLTGGTTYKTVVCLTSNTITNSVTELDGSAKCGNEFVPGVKFDASIDGEGFLIDPITTNPTNIGFAELYTAFVNRTIVGIAFGPAQATSGKAIYDGQAFITNLEQSAPDDELVTFTVTFKCAAPPFTQTITY